VTFKTVFLAIFMVLLTYAVLVGCDTFMLKDQFSAVGDSIDGDSTPGGNDSSKNEDDTSPLKLASWFDEISQGDSVYLFVSGGSPPYSFEDSLFDFAYDAGEGTFHNFLYTASDSIGGIKLTVTDSLGASASDTISVLPEAPKNLSFINTDNGSGKEIHWKQTKSGIDDFIIERRTNGIGDFVERYNRDDVEESDPTPVESPPGSGEFTFSDKSNPSEVYEYQVFSVSESLSESFRSKASVIPVWNKID